MAKASLEIMDRILAAVDMRVIACSGGIDSLLLATVAHRASPERTRVVHAISPAVPTAATTRLRQWADHERWRLDFVDSGEFDDENYLSNPSNRCYFCKRHLYGSLHLLCGDVKDAQSVVFSGANVDDLGEYRPGLIAASENGVRHPWIEADFTKQDIRALARDLGLPFAELPASPCLASRLYTGTRVTAQRLRAVEAGEELIRHDADIAVVRCRLLEDHVLIEVGHQDRSRITTDLVMRTMALMQSIEPTILDVQLDAESYRPGRAFRVNA